MHEVILHRLAKPIRCVVSEEPKQYPPPCRYTMMESFRTFFLGVKVTTGTFPKLVFPVRTPKGLNNFPTIHVCGCTYHWIILGEGRKILYSNLLPRSDCAIRRLRRLNHSPRPMFAQTFQQATGRNPPLDYSHSCFTTIFSKNSIFQARRTKVRRNQW